MGRYYNGDIEGKFWFAVQASDDASFFGGEVIEPCEIDYQFTVERDMATVEDGLKKCKEKLGANKELLDEFFKDENGYNNEMLQDKFGWSEEKTKEYLVWYARLDLGEKIYNCLKESDEGTCSFTAEC